MIEEPGRPDVEVPVPVVPFPEVEAVPEVEAAVAEEFGGIDVDLPRIGIVLNDAADHAVMDEAARELDLRRIRYETRVMSAHEQADQVAEYARNAKMRGLQVIIAGAALGAALPAVVSGHTELPVIGVPLATANSVAGGLDSLLAIAQSPADAPVGCVAVNGARSAAVLAARIVA